MNNQGQHSHRRLYVLIFVVILLVIAAVVIFSIKQQNSSNKNDKPIETNLDSVYHYAAVYYTKNGHTFNDTQSIINALSSSGITMKPTSGVASTGADVSVAVAGGGEQLSLVSTDGSACLAILVNSNMSTGTGIPNAPSTPGILYGLWAVPQTGCIATPIPSSSAYGGLGAPTWSSKW